MGLSMTAYTPSTKPTTPNKPTGVLKLYTTSPAKPKFHLHSTAKHFWNTDLDGTTRLAINPSTGTIPEQSNTYTFTPSHFTHEPYPSSFPSGRSWPPQRIEDVAYAGDCTWDGGCVGETCYTRNFCEAFDCEHTFEKWQKATANWEEYFELKMTEERGIGVFARRAFEEGDVLGWYAGELKTLDNCGEGDYLMEMEIGDYSSGWRPYSDVDSNHSDDEVDCPTASIDGEKRAAEHESDDGDDSDEVSGPTVYIDGERKGNWARFINHSCMPYAVFHIRRVGEVRIMTVESVRDVPAGEELTVSYGSEYYGLETRKVCCCGAENCVGKKRRLQEETKGVEGERRVKVKKCQRVGPPS